jgi:hypothetical protein
MRWTAHAVPQAGYACAARIQDGRTQLHDGFTPATADLDLLWIAAEVHVAAVARASARTALPWCVAEDLSFLPRFDGAVVTCRRLMQG